MSTYEREILLKVEKLNTGYGKRQVLFDASFSIGKGDITLLIGGNGSGKSTVLKAIYGLLTNYEDPDGKISFNDEDITNTSPFHMIKKGLVYVPQKNNTFKQLSVEENLEVASVFLSRKVVNNRIKGVYKKLPELDALRKRKPFQLSGGENQLLALGMALMQQPKMIMLDEPGAGLSPKSWQKNLELIKTLNMQGITFLIVEHKVKETKGKVDNILQMKLGKINNNSIKTN